MLRNRNWRLERKTGRPVLNEVLSLNAQEFLHEPAPGLWVDSSMKS